MRFGVFCCRRFRHEDQRVGLLVRGGGGGGAADASPRLLVSVGHRGARRGRPAAQVRCARLPGSRWPRRSAPRSWASAGFQVGAALRASRSVAEVQLVFFRPVRAGCRYKDIRRSLERDIGERTLSAPGLFNSVCVCVCFHTLSA